MSLATSTPSFASSGDTTPDSTSLTPMTIPRSSPLPKGGPLQVRCQVRTRIPTPYGQFHLHVYHNNFDDKEHLALVFSETVTSTSLNQLWSGDNPTRRIVRGASSEVPTDTISSPTTSTTLVRIHSECFTGETVASVRCDCGEQLDRAMRRMSEEKSGVILYLRQEGRGIGLLEKMRAYNLQDLGYDTVDANLLLGLPADNREYQVGAAILRDLDITTVQLLTNNPKKLSQLRDHGIQVDSHISMVPRAWEEAGDHPTKVLSPSSSPFLTHPFQSETDAYLRTKIHRMGHMLEPPEV